MYLETRCFRSELDRLTYRLDGEYRSRGPPNKVKLITEEQNGQTSDEAAIRSPQCSAIVDCFQVAVAKACQLRDHEITKLEESRSRVKASPRVIRNARNPNYDDRRDNILSFYNIQVDQIGGLMIVFREKLIGENAGG